MILKLCALLQRLEQPEACPREYYNIMLKCWQHDALKRPKFDDLMNILPEVCIYMELWQLQSKLSIFQLSISIIFCVCECACVHTKLFV